MASVFFFAGHPGSGKTFFLLELARFLSGKGNEVVLFKPFEKGLRLKNAEETPTDAELFAKASPGRSINLHNLYHYQGEGVLEFLAEREMTPFDFKAYEERLALLGERCRILFVELTGSLSEPVGPGLVVRDLIPETSPAFWFFNASPAEFPQNYPELDTLKTLPRHDLLPTNVRRAENPAWLHYLWNLIQERKEIPVRQMVPFNPRRRCARWKDVFEYFASFLP